MTDLECSRCGATDDRENGVVVFSVNYENPDQPQESYPNVYHEEVCTPCRAAELREQTVLSPRRAEVKAFVEAGYARQEIADQLGISVHTVDEHKQEVKKKIDQAETTVDLLG